MDELRSRPARRPEIKALGWIGVWTSLFLLFPGLTLWLSFFHLPRWGGWPPLGTSRFWEVLGAYAFMPTMMSFSIWRRAKKPTRATGDQKPAMPGDKYKRGGAAVVLVGFLIARVMAASPGVSPNWFGVIGGAAALAGLFAAAMFCAKWALPDSADTAVVLAQAPPAAPAVRVPKNRFRAEATLREMAYRRPLSTRVGTAALSGFMLVIAAYALAIGACALWFSGILPAPHMHKTNIWAAVIMLPGAVMFAGGAFTLLGLVGPDELRVSPRDGTYVYRTGGLPQSAPAKAAVAFWMREEALRDGLRLPWRIQSFTGCADDMAGVEIREVQGKATVCYFLALRWTLPERPPMRLGIARTKADALALQAQAAEDLGVPSL